MSKHQIPLRITIEVDDTPAPAAAVKVREVPGGAVLDVPPETRRQLIAFGWAPPADGA